MSNKPKLESLVEEFPKIFAKRHGDKYKYRIARGFECGEGWYNLLRRLCHVIQNEIDSNASQRKYAVEYNEMIYQAMNGNTSLLDEKYKNWNGRDKENLIADGFRKVPDQISQLEVDLIKEKFGGLRFHKMGGSDFSNGAIAMAEAMSFTICDVCGQTGKVGNQDAPPDYKGKAPGYYATRCTEHWGRQQDDGTYKFYSVKEIENGES